MSGTRRREPLSPKALEDLVRMIFEELDPGRLDFKMTGRMGSKSRLFHRVHVVGIPSLV